MKEMYLRWLPRLFLTGAIAASLSFFLAMQIGLYGWAVVDLLIGCFNWYWFLEWRDRLRENPWLITKSN